MSAGEGRSGNFASSGRCVTSDSTSIHVQHTLQTFHGSCTHAEEAARSAPDLALTQQMPEQALFECCIPGPQTGLLTSCCQPKLLHAGL